MTEANFCDEGRPHAEFMSVEAQNPADGSRAPSFTDEALALIFAERFAPTLRFVATWGKWLRWEDTHWRIDNTLFAFDLARKICREAAANCEDERLKRVLASAHTVAAVFKLARTDRRIAATPEQWDRDPWLLNTPSATIDLRTGACRVHCSEDYSTKLTAVEPGRGCPLWHKFLDRVTAGDAEMQRFLKRACGYALTGSTREHVLFFLLGTGANGKSVFLDTIAGVLGDYHRTSGMDTFTTSAGERHPTDLAALRGARLVTAGEIEEGRRWAESRVKAVTGGDKISARFMRQDFFEFEPQFKLFIAGNHTPGLRSVDKAIRRRLRLVPFKVTIPPAERDHTLAEQLAEEWSGILDWMIEGCLEWQRHGLQEPPAVQQATTAYLASEDALGTWMEECCSLDPKTTGSSSALYGSWKSWAEQTGEHAGSMKAFSQALEARGFERFRTRAGSEFRGLKLQNPNQAGGSRWAA
jgi:putative DNA primase/helicase